MLKLNEHTQEINLNLKPAVSRKNCSHVRARVSLYTTVVLNTAQNSSDNFPLIVQTIIIAEMMSTGGERGAVTEAFAGRHVCGTVCHRPCDRTSAATRLSGH